MVPDANAIRLLLQGRHTPVYLALDRIESLLSSFLLTVFFNVGRDIVYETYDYPKEIDKPRAIL